MKIHEQQNGAVMVLRPDGSLVADEARDFTDRSVKVLRENMGRMVLDASSVPYVDSKGLESLVLLADELSRSGPTRQLCAMNETVRQVLRLTGLSARFDHFEDVNTAVRSFL